MKRIIEAFGCLVMVILCIYLRVEFDLKRQSYMDRAAALIYKTIRRDADESDNIVSDRDNSDSCSL